MMLFDDPFSGAVFSDDRRYRFRLWRTWSSRPRVCFCMLNPSTANETELDPTLRRCVSFARAWEFGGLEVVNLFAIVSADPKVLLTDPNPRGDKNDEYIRRAANRCGAIVAAWGAFPEATVVARHVYAMLRADGVQPWCLGTTKHGHPCHPLYIPSSRRLVQWGGPEC